MTLKRWSGGISIGLAAVLGCAATQGAGPRELSVAQHDAAALQDEKAAAVHVNQLEPGATAVLGQCRPGPADALRVSSSGPDVCWTSTTDPSDGDQRAAEEHRRWAAAHRASSAALREAEGRACVGLPADDRDVSPFEHTADIASVTPLNEHHTSSRQSYEQSVGATVTFRAVPGMTAERLQRVVDCHLARNASLGHVVPEMPDCPLVPRGAEARVSSTGTGFAVAIRASDGAAAKEILARAERLVPAPGADPASRLKASPRPGE